jgi:hypothetical protein
MCANISAHWPGTWKTGHVFVSLGIRFVATEKKAVTEPSPLMSGSVLAPLACTPPLQRDCGSVDRGRRLGRRQLRPQRPRLHRRRQHLRDDGGEADRDFPLDAARAPRWGAAWKAWLRANANGLGTASSQVETLPYEDHFLDLDPTVRDPHGSPVARITFDLKENERRAALFLQEKLALWLREAGAAETWTTPVALHVNTHAFGGTRMGADRTRASSIDGACRTRLRTSASSARRPFRPPAAETPPRRCKPWRGAPRTVSWQAGVT